MSRYNIAIIVSFFLLFTIAFAQNETADPCAGITCNPTTTTCPDGYTATCTNTCSGGTCGTCTPDCAGHETVNKCAGITCNPSTLTCPDSYAQTCPNTCDSNTGSCSTCTPDCSQHQTITQQCPAEPPKPTCPPDQLLKPVMDNNNCIIRYECYTSGQDVCAQVITPAVDGVGNCQEFSNSCLPPGWRSVDRCPLPGEGSAYCGNKICEIGEDSNNCLSDCEPQAKCPPSIQCPDGSTRKCYPVGSSCGCDSCGPPPGCHEEKDSTGFVRTVCDTTNVQKLSCPEIPQDIRIKCVDNGGTPTFRKDPAGCEVFDCRFAGQVSGSPVQVFTQYQCPTKEEWEMTSKKCATLRLRTVAVMEGGCNIPKCVQEEAHREECGLVPGPERQRIEAECRAKGLGWVSKFDESGCQRIECGQEFDCARDMPKQAYDRCYQDGGEMVVKRDNRGCIAFTDCVMRGDDTKVFVERVDSVPESTELLAVAFKLESLKIELDKLARQTDEIADYYKSVGSGEENRFRRVSDMFGSAKDKVDEIKNKIKDRLKDITVDDMMEIKQDIKYIKDVMIKDIVYVMLSSSDDVMDIVESRPLDVAENTDVSDCGTDGMCFERSFRVCKQVSFRPEGSSGPVVKVIGLEDNACIMKVTLPEGQGPPAGFIPGINPPYEMKCRIEKYSLGVRNPDTDIIPYCEGNLKELMKYGPPPGSGGGSRGGEEGNPCGDGICDDFEQRNPDACPRDCGQLTQQQTSTAVRNQPVQPAVPVQSMGGGGGATTTSECPSVQEIRCPAGQVRIARSDSSGCIIGYDCVNG